MKPSTISQFHGTPRSRIVAKPKIDPQQEGQTEMGFGEVTAKQMHGLPRDDSEQEGRAEKGQRHVKCSTEHENEWINFEDLDFWGLVAVSALYLGLVFAIGLVLRKAVIG